MELLKKDKKVTGRVDVLVEQLNSIGPKANRWPLALLNKCFMENKIPAILRTQLKSHWVNLQKQHSACQF